MSALEKIAITVTEYLELERAHPELKSEFVNGEIFVMAGASEVHVTIVSNLVGELYAQFKRRPCKVYASDMRVKVNKNITDKGGDYVYPDVVALCQKPVLIEQDNLTNPRLIIEVLSSTTEKYDLGQKAELYRAIPSLQDYILIAQNRHYVAHYQRQNNQSWLLHEYRDENATINLDAMQAKLNLIDIYDKVIFEGS